MPILFLLACTPAPPPDVLLVTLDTTRADALGRGDSPTLDGLAASGLFVPEARTVAPLTLPAHAAILTGEPPERTHVHDNLGAPFDGGVPTLAERLSAAGYSTCASVGAIVLDRRFGLDRGFDSYAGQFDAASLQTPGDALLERPAADVAGDIATCVAEADERPIFAWAHLFDAHAPYVDGYGAEIGRDDRAVQAMLDAWAAAGRSDRLVLVVVGDHGESMDEHGERTHGLLIYRSTMHVPMLVWGRGVAAGVADGPRSVIDVAPTILALAGVDAELPGRDLRSAADPERIVTGEGYHGRFAWGLAGLRVAEDRDWRFIEAPEPELYASTDPGETLSVAAQHPDVVQRLRAALPPPPADPGTVDADLAGALAALGYAEAGAMDATLVDADLPDPKRFADLPDRFDDLVLRSRTRAPAEAIPDIEAFVAEWPHAAGGAWLLAAAREHAGDRPGARQALAPVLAAHPKDPAARVRVAQLFLDEGDAAAALAELAHVERPSAAAHGVRAAALRRQGDCGGAMREADAGIALDPLSPGLHRVRGACRLESGDAALAVEDFEVARPTDPDGQLLHGVALLRAGRPADAIDPLRRALQASPDDLDRVAELGAALYLAGRYSEARDPLERAVQAHPSAYPMLADTVLRLDGPIPEVEALLDRGLAAGADVGDTHRIRSSLRSAQGDVAGAIQEMEAANQ